MSIKAQERAERLTTQAHLSAPFQGNGPRGGETLLGRQQGLGQRIHFLFSFSILFSISNLKYSNQI
jgi:hypothetical protein